MRRTDPPQLPSIRPLQRLAILSLVVLLMPLAPTASAVEDPPDFTLFSRPHKTLQLSPDPWLGGIWMATEAGVFLKDMQTGSMRHYGVQDGLPAPYAHDVAATPDKVWLCTALGPAVLDKATQEVHLVRSADGSRLQANCRVMGVESGTAWFGTTNDGLFRIDTDTLRATPVPNPVNGSRFEHPVLGVGTDGTQVFISAEGYGLVRWDRATGEAQRYNYTYTWEQPQYGRLLVSDDYVWVGTSMDGVMKLDRRTGSLFEYMGPSSTNALSVTSAVQMGDEFYFATITGIARYNAATDTWRDWRGSGFGTSDLALLDGKLYVALNEGGIASFDRERETWVPQEWWRPDQGPQHNAVYACSHDGQRLLFGTGGGGANFYDPATGDWARAGHEPGDQGKPRQIAIFGVHSTDERRWFTHSNGFSEVDRATGEYTHQYTDGRSPDSPPFYNRVNDVDADGSEAWFASSSVLKSKTNPAHGWSHGNVARWVPATQEMQLYGPDDGLSSNNVSRVALDGDRLWVGTDVGIDVIDRGSGEITQVFPSEGRAPVQAILPLPDAVWFGTAFHGVLRVDRETLEVTQVTSIAGAPIQSLAEAGGVLWVGTGGRGVFALDPVELTATRYGTGWDPQDYFVYCLQPAGDILYMGTGWGVVRFDVSKRLFLSQAPPPDQRDEVPPPPSGITIDSPEAGDVLPEETIVVRGRTTNAPPDASVMVRLGDGAWRSAQGVASWEIQMSPGDVLGKTYLTARLESADGLLAQAVREVRVGTAVQAPSDGGGEVRVLHNPVLDAWRGEQTTFSITAGDVEGLQAEMELLRPGADATERVSLVEREPGRWRADVSFDATGAASYRILVRWPDGSQRLPDPFAYGSWYSLTVHSAAGHVAARVAAPETISLVPGEGAAVKVQVQNIGIRDGAFDISLEGPGAAMVEEAPGPITVPAGETYTLEIMVNGQRSHVGTHLLQVVATPRDGTAGWATVQVIVAEHEALQESGRNVPLPVAWLLVGMAVAARMRRQ